jgi:Zinc finger, C3HC4 type (RING finger)
MSLVLHLLAVLALATAAHAKDPMPECASFQGWHVVSNLCSSWTCTPEGYLSLHAGDNCGVSFSSSLSRTVTTGRLDVEIKVSRIFPSSGDVKLGLGVLNGSDIHGRALMASLPVNYYDGYVVFNDNPPAHEGDYDSSPLVRLWCHAVPSECKTVYQEQLARVRNTSFSLNTWHTLSFEVDPERAIASIDGVAYMSVVRDLLPRLSNIAIAPSQMDAIIRKVSFTEAGVRFFRSSSSLTQPIYAGAAASWRDTVAFAGGDAQSNCYGGQFVNTVDIFQGGQHIRTGQLGQARRLLSGVGAAGYLVFAGGTVGTRCGVGTSAVDFYHIATNTWTFSPELLSVPRLNMAADAVADGEIAMFAGGTRQCNGQKYNVADLINVTAKRLLSPAKLSLARMLPSSGCARFGGQVWFLVAGGISAQGETSVVDIFDVQARTWVAGQFDLSVARYRAAVASVGCLTCFAGGNMADDTRSSDAMDIFDASKRFSRITRRLVGPRGSLAAGVIGSSVLIAGGYSPSTRYASTVEVLDTSTFVVSAAPDLEVGVGGLKGGTGSDGFVYFGVGASSGYPCPTQKVAIYNCEGCAEPQAPTMPGMTSSAFSSTTLSSTAFSGATVDSTPQVPNVESPSGARTSASGSSPWWIAVVIAFIIGLVVAGYFVWRRRQSNHHFTPIPALDEDEVLEDCGASAKNIAEVEDRHEMIEIDSDSSSNSDEVQTVPVDDGDDSEACTVCMTAKIDTAFVPCGHISCCGRCAKKCEKHGACPICRKPIDSVMKTFRS